MRDGVRFRVVKSGRLVNPADPVQVEKFYRHFRATIPLDRALLCLDCESIFEAEGTQKCPACGGNIAWAIGRALGNQRIA